MIIIFEFRYKESNSIDHTQECVIDFITDNVYLSLAAHSFAYFIPSALMLTLYYQVYRGIYDRIEKNSSVDDRGSFLRRVSSVVRKSFTKITSKGVETVVEAETKKEEQVEEEGSTISNIENTTSSNKNDAEETTKLSEYFRKTDEMKILSRNFFENFLMPKA